MHVLKNIMIPVVTVIGLEFGSVIAFSVVTGISSLAGHGQADHRLDQRPRPADHRRYLMLIVALFVTINLIVDIIYTLLDPRVRVGGQEA